MTEILKLESTLTDRYQTTVPDVVRRTLGLEKRDKICYVIGQDGTGKKMLDNGNPPDKWSSLLKQVQNEDNRLENIIDRIEN